MLRKDEKTAVIEANKTHEKDTGSPEVQIAILTRRISDLTEHLKTHKKKPSQLPQEEGHQQIQSYYREAGYP